MEQRRASRGEDRFHHARRQHHYLSEWIVKHFSEVEIRPPGQRMPGTHDGKPGKGRELGDDLESVIVLQDTGFGDGEVDGPRAKRAGHHRRVVHRGSQSNTRMLGGKSRGADRPEHFSHVGAHSH